MQENHDESLANDIVDNTPKDAPQVYYGLVGGFGVAVWLYLEFLAASAVKTAASHLVVVLQQSLTDL